jgi:hypothetical protein
MPIATVAAGPANLIQTNAAMRAELAAAAALLQFAALFGAPGTIAVSGVVRIDIQGPWSAGPGRNIQAQVANSSIAAIRLADTLGAAVGAVNQAAVVAAAQAALLASENTGQWQNVTGTSP